MSDSNSQAEQYRDDAEQSTQKRAALIGINYVDSRQISQTKPLIANVLDVQDMYKTKIVPLEINLDSGRYLFGITSSTPQSVINSLRESYQNEGKITDFVLISDLGFKEFMNRYDPPKEIIYDDVELASEGDSSTLDEVSKTLESVSTDRIMDYLIDQADRLNASDIHIESQRENVRLRLRVDGMLHPVATISHDKYRVLLGSIASRANISTASAHPQSGHMQRMSAVHNGKLINMRIETVTTTYGMDCVIRLFDFDESLLNIDSLGLDEKRRAAIEDLIKHPHGLMMVVGPTGSGKSTTLYSILNALNSPSRKILTLEDPVEISLPGVSQIPISADNGTGSFAEGLRAILRLDPDVVMVGEIRDAETARTAIQASITGHLVLSTFHASSAAAAFARIIDMIGQNPIFANAIRMVAAQRLVRRLDDETKTEYEPDDSTKEWIRGVLKDLPDDIEKHDLDNIKLYKPGTSAVSPFGYKGRIMIMEQLTVDSEIQEFIRGEMKDIDVNEIEQSAKRSGMLTMIQDGVLRVLKGDTTLEEINRVL